MSDADREQKRRAAAQGDAEDQERHARAKERVGASPSSVRPALVAEIAARIYPGGPSAARCVLVARKIVDLAYGATDDELRTTTDLEAAELAKTLNDALSTPTAFRAHFGLDAEADHNLGEIPPR